MKKNFFLISLLFISLSFFSCADKEKTLIEEKTTEKTVEEKTEEKTIDKNTEDKTGVKKTDEKSKKEPLKVVVTCPVMEGKVDPSLKSVEYKGYEVRFCCPGCEQEFAKDPDKYIAKIEANPDKYLEK